MAISYFETAWNSAGTEVGDGTHSYKDLSLTGLSVGDLVVVAAIGENCQTGTQSISTQSGSLSAWNTSLPAVTGFNDVDVLLGWATVTNGSTATIRVQLRLPSGFMGIAAWVIPAAEWDSGTNPSFTNIVDDADGAISTSVANNNSIVLYAGGDWTAVSLGSNWAPDSSIGHADYADGTRYSVAIRSWTGQLAGTRTYGPSGLSGRDVSGGVVVVKGAGASGPSPISLRAAGTATSATAAVTAVNPSVPSGAQTGDLSVLTVWAKPYNTTIGTPTGWTKIAEATNGTTAAGTDTGSTKVAVFVQESASVGAIGNLSLTSANSAGAVINTYSKDSSQSWDYSQFTSGGDSTNGSNYSATGAAGIDVAAGDWVLQGTAVNGDVGTQSAQAIAGMSGATRGTYVVRQSADVTTGTDSHGEIGDIPITAGSSTAAPTFTYTNGSSGSGTTIWLRLRQVPGTTSVSQSMQTSWTVLKTVVDSLQTSWNVQVSLTQVTAALNTSWNAYSTLTASRSTSWNVQKFVNAARSMTWNVNALVSNARSTTWSVLTSIQTSRSTSWNTIGRIVANRSSLWNVGQTISASRSTSWTVLTSTTKNLSSTWNVLNVVSSSRSTSWNIFTAVQSTRSTTWNTVGRINSSRSTTWNTLISATATKSTSWFVYKAIDKSLSTQWNVITKTTSTKLTSWNVVGRVSSTRSLLWHANASLVKATSTSWNVAYRVGNQRNTSWNVNQLIGQTRSTSWNVADPVYLVTSSRSTLWNVDSALLSVSKSTSTLWHISARVNASKSNIWNVRSFVSNTRSTSWTISRSINKATSISWHVNARINQARSMLWNVNAFVYNTRSSSWNVFVQISTSRLTFWNLSGRIIQSRSTLWVVNKSISANRSTTWTIRSITRCDQSTYWHLYNKVGQDLTTSWANSAFALSSLTIFWDILGPGSHFWVWDGSNLETISLNGEWNGQIVEELNPYAEEVVR